MKRTNSYANNELNGMPFAENEEKPDLADILIS